MLWKTQIGLPQAGLDDLHFSVSITEIKKKMPKEVQATKESKQMDFSWQDHIHHWYKVSFKSFSSDSHLTTAIVIAQRLRSAESSKGTMLFIAAGVK